MRWDDLFADLEAQSQAMWMRERAGDVEELTRTELTRLTLVDRLAPTVGTLLTLHCLGDVRVSGTVSRVGPDWLLLDEDQGREAVVNLPSLITASGLSRMSSAPDRPATVESRLPLRSILRELARDRSSVRVHLVDSTVIEGTIDRVGGDFFELAAHGVGELRRRADVRQGHLVVHAAVSAVRRQI